MLEPGHRRISLGRQCELLGIGRGTVYYRRRPRDELNERLMRLIDEQYLRTPFYGVEQMRLYLRRLLVDEGIVVNAKRVRRLMRLMGLEAIYPKPRTSVKSPENTVYPYLLKGLVIDRSNQVWCTDITYIPMERGWVYLVAVMDWFSRYVLSWEVSVTLDASFCVWAVERALLATQGVPEIFNSDQGSQFTSEAFTGVLKEAGIRISMDGRGRAYDNIFVERLWRSVKYEEVYLHDYQTPAEARLGLNRYFEFYNHQRPHQSLGGWTPAEKHGLRAAPWPVKTRMKEGEAACSTASPLALRAHCEAVEQAETSPP
jgi:putative transposase